MQDIVKIIARLLSLVTKYKIFRILKIEIFMQDIVKIIACLLSLVTKYKIFCHLKIETFQHINCNKMFLDF